MTSSKAFITAACCLGGGYLLNMIVRNVALEAIRQGNPQRAFETMQSLGALHSLAALGYLVGTVFLVTGVVLQIMGQSNTTESQSGRLERI